MGQEVVMVGGGDAALQEALHLAMYCSKVTMVVRGNRLRARQSYVAQAADDPKFAFRWNSVVEAVEGADVVEGVTVRDTKKDTVESLACTGVFVFVGVAPNTGYLPDEVLLRRKDGMSDAVGTNWVDQLKAYAEQDVSDGSFKEIRSRAKYYNTPLTKEEALYRSCFWKMFGKDNDHLISEIWRPKWTTIKDPSARLLLRDIPVK